MEEGDFGRLKICFVRSQDRWEMRASKDTGFMKENRMRQDSYGRGNDMFGMRIKRAMTLSEGRVPLSLTLGKVLATQGHKRH